MKISKQELMKELKEAHEFIDAITDGCNKPEHSASCSIEFGKENMPKEMSDWFDKMIKSGNARRITEKNTTGRQNGYVMKSRDCTVVLFPNWNCNEQFASISNRFE